MALIWVWASARPLSGVVFEKVLEKRSPPLLGHVHLVLEVAAVSDLSVLDFPAQVLDLGLKLGLLAFKLKK